VTGEEREIWDRLVAEQPIPDVMASPLGWEAWQRVHADEASQIVVARDGDEPVALAALATVHRPLGALHATRLLPAGDLHWACSYPITGRDVTAGVRSLLSQLASKRDWDELLLGPMLAASPTFAALMTVGEELGMLPVVDARGSAPRTLIAGSWETYYAGRSANLRAEVARGERKLAKLGPIVLEEQRGGAGLDAALHAFFGVEATGWKRATGTAIACDPTLRALYTELAREAAACGRLRMFLLHAGDHVVAASYTIEHERGVFLLKTGYDDAYAKASPGYVLHKQLLARLWASGDVDYFDFMTGGGDHAGYKLRWANDTRAYMQVRLFRPRSLRGLALAGLVRLKRAVENHREHHA